MNTLLPNTPFPEAAPPPSSRSARRAPDARQLDFFRSLWSPATPAPAAERPVAPAKAPRPATPSRPANTEDLLLNEGTVRVEYVRHPRARRYRLLFRRDGGARCTVPPRGTLAEARRFVASQHAWLEAQRRRFASLAHVRQTWRPGDTVLWDGESAVLELLPATPDTPAQLRLGPLRASVFTDAEDDLRPAAEAAMRAHAQAVLPARTAQLAAELDLAGKLRRVTIRNQRTRWGSCSRRGVISLNWRLVQLPPAVREYILYHELAHLVHLNHSPRFWATVAGFCPGYEASELWLRKSGRQVL